MKFIISSSVLYRQLQVLSGVLTTRNALPILEHFLFEVEKDALTLTATDLETTITVKLKVEARETFRIAIPARILLDALKSFAEQPLTFTLKEKTYGVEIASDYGKYSLAGSNPVEYPRTPQPIKANYFELSSGFLLEALDKTLCATSGDTLRPVMCGVFFDMQKEKLVVVATDAHKMARFTSMEAVAKKLQPFIAPKKALSILKSILNDKDENEKVSISSDKTTAYFKYDNYRIACRLIEGKYPAYDAVIPKENPNELIVERQILLSAVKRISLFANKNLQAVRLLLGEKQLKVSAEDLDFSSNAFEHLASTYKGKKMEIGFNANFLSEILSVMDTKEIKIAMSLPNRAALLLPVYAGEKEDKENKQPIGDLLMLLMPVMLNQ